MDIENALIGRFAPFDHHDISSRRLKQPPEFTADDVQATFWTNMPAPVVFLMKLRNVLVKPFGLETGEIDLLSLENCIRNGESYGLFSLAAKSDRETVLLLTDTHLSAYVSVILDGTAIHAYTGVKFHRTFGKFYFYLILPFHKLVVDSALKNAVKILTKQS